MMVPCGYRFRPRDEELFVYLQRKIHKLPLPCDIIREVELYKYDPSDLLGQFISKGEEKCYFFTPTYRKYAKGSRPNRATNNGYWKASTADIQIKDEEDNDIGTKRTLVFYSGEHPHGRKTNWIMHEYKLMEYQNTSTNVQTPIDPMKLDEWVLCSIYENLSGDKREKMKRKASEELDTRTEKRPFVVQEPQSQINEHKANDPYVVSSYDIHKKEPIHDASDMGWDIGLMSDSDFAKLMEMTATEEVGTKREERTAVVQQEQPQIEYGDNDQSVVVFSADYLEDIISWDIPLISDSYYADLAELTEVMTGEELDTRSEINVVQDNNQSMFFSYDDLQKLPILDASDMEGWDDIPPIPMSDSDFDDFEELMEMMPGEELDRRSEITVSESKDNDQSIVFSYDGLEKGPILDASDMVGWDDIPPIPMSDSDFDDFAEFMEMMPGEELDRRSEITVSENKDNDQSMVFSYDGLEKGPILDASDMDVGELKILKDLLS